MRISILFFIMSFIFYLIPENKNKNIVFEREYKIKRTTMEEINYYSTIYSKKYKIEKNLLLAVMKFESNFNPRCKNPKSSAFGLGQFLGGDYWIWNYPDYNKNYIVCADVARGDGSDYSAFHVIDVESCEQVAEYKSHIDTRTYGNMLVSVATEYNNALLVVENANIGWDVVNTIIEKGYSNLYYSPRTYGELNIDKWMSKMDNDQTVPGFTTSNKTRPLVVSKMEAYIRDRHFIFHSKRLLEELRVFIWMNGKAQAQSGYNDDLVMALGIGLFVRDTGVKFYQQSLNLQRAAIDNISSTVQRDIIGNNITHNPYRIETQYGVEDITWLL